MDGAEAQYRPNPMVVVLGRAGAAQWIVGGGMSERLLVWQWLSEPGLEGVYLDANAPAVLARSRALGVWDGQPVRAAYRLTLDADWCFRHLYATWTDPSGMRRIRLWRTLMAAGTMRAARAPTWMAASTLM